MYHPHSHPLWISVLFVLCCCALTMVLAVCRIRLPLNLLLHPIHQQHSQFWLSFRFPCNFPEQKNKRKKDYIFFGIEVTARDVENPLFYSSGVEVNLLVAWSSTNATMTYQTQQIISHPIIKI